MVIYITAWSTLFYLAYIAYNENDLMHTKICDIFDGLVVVQQTTMFNFSFLIHYNMNTNFCVPHLASTSVA
jgi:hypothetical protein